VQNARHEIKETTESSPLDLFSILLFYATRAFVFPNGSLWNI